MITSLVLAAIIVSGPSRTLDSEGLISLVFRASIDTESIVIHASTGPTGWYNVGWFCKSTGGPRPRLKCEIGVESIQPGAACAQDKTYTVTACSASGECSKPAQEIVVKCLDQETCPCRLFPMEAGP